MVLELLDPWILVEVGHVSVLNTELAKEVGPNHPLWGKETKAIARRIDRDDVLFLLDTERGACVVVHLVGGGGMESDPRWPRTEIFSSLEEWTEKRMQPDHLDYTSE